MSVITMQIITTIFNIKLMWCLALYRPEAYDRNVNCLSYPTNHIPSANSTTASILKWKSTSDITRMFPSCLSSASGNASNSRHLPSFLWTARLTLDAQAGDGSCVHLNPLVTAVSIKNLFTSVLPATKSVIFVDACSTLVVPLMCSFRILSLRVTPHIHLSILASFTYMLSCFLSCRCCPGLCTIQPNWSDHSFVNLSI